MRQNLLFLSGGLPASPPADCGRTTRPASRTSRTRTIAAALGAVAVLALTACGGSGEGVRSEGRDAVDTLASSSPGAGTATPATPAGNGSPGSKDAERPQLRLDTSEQEQDRLWDAYWACLQSHGVPMNTKRVAGSGRQAPPLDQDSVKPRYRPAYDTCQIKMPLQPPEYDEDKNPHFADDIRAAVKCMRHRGMKVHVPSGSDMEGLWWAYDEDQTGAPAEEPAQRAEKECRLEAFGGK
ncbi:hypothetical protein ACFWN1_17620 [Streptomyces sp. NPDC058459]|uniref:hypothetical protein n=1 Tax=Streptomyces sp. NPDC058459 TaxID=3346508 RepID=UPI003651EDCE